MGGAWEGVSYFPPFCIFFLLNEMTRSSLASFEKKNQYMYTSSNMLVIMGTMYSNIVLKSCDNFSLVYLNNTLFFFCLYDVPTKKFRLLPIQPSGQKLSGIHKQRIDLA